MNDQATETREVISLKQELLRRAPYSGARYGGKDVVFFMKEGQPGTDAFLYDDGTVMVRQFFGDEKKMRRYGSFKKSKDRLFLEGYKPYNLFAPDGTLLRYESEHESAKMKAATARSFFPTVEKVKFQPQSRLGYEQVALKQPVFYGQQPVSYSPISYPAQQNKGPPQNNDSAYQRLFKNLDEFGRNIRPEQRIVVPNTYKILSGSQYANWAQKELSAITRRRQGEKGKDKGKDKNKVAAAEYKASVMAAKYRKQKKELEEGEEQ